ncbi:hypothetical protein TSAR_016152 [Trichomalopsis sarcophagae]|uniref:Uncharacterized protein n=1 Tax=Trichomalopsis sarcophagae TaxID=543379 RepID=A0A232FCH5_9HYME|nr:hypothetical protein TSAR_016152 [Trichomalopsis sarcophagae]
MTLLFKWLFLLSLAYSVQIVVFADHFDSAVSDVACFFQARLSSFVERCKFGRLLLDRLSQPTDILSKMDQLSEIELDSKLKDIYEYSGKINYFPLYSNTSIRHENETIRKFYDVLTDLGDSAMRAHLSD